jgi:hypothetical protein
VERVGQMPLASPPFTFLEKFKIEKMKEIYQIVTTKVQIIVKELYSSILNT